MAAWKSLLLRSVGYRTKIDAPKATKTKARDFRPVLSSSSCDCWEPQVTNYSAASVLAQAVPPPLKRITPDWSEQNARWPLWPFTLGVASDV